MKYLNLTKGFDPFGVNDTEKVKYDKTVSFESFFFNGGEPHIKLKGSKTQGTWGVGEELTITTRLNSMNDVGLLMVAVDAVKNTLYKGQLHLFTPYLPGARQDRLMVGGEPLTVKVYANIINSMNFDSVTIFDPHSDVAPALIENSSVVDNHKFVNHCIVDIHSEIGEHPLRIISPDAGSNKKIDKLMISLSKSWRLPLTKCDKHRQQSTGKLFGFEVYAEDLNGVDCVIVDDICDAGGTFMGLAEELKNKNAGDIYLIISHGIFSAGLKNLSRYFKKIYTTDSWRTEFDWEQKEREPIESVKIIPFKKFL